MLMVNLRCAIVLQWQARYGGQNVQILPEYDSSAVSP